MMAPRSLASIDAAGCFAADGQAFTDVVDPARAGAAVDLGFVAHDAAGLRLTPKGRPLLNAILAELV